MPYSITTLHNGLSEPLKPAAPSIACPPGFFRRVLPFGKKLLHLAVCFAVLAGLAGAALPPFAHARVETEEFIERRDFRGMVRRDMAETAARTAAEVAAMEYASRILAKEPGLNFVNETDEAAPPPPPPIDGLARLLFATRVSAFGMQGFPPNVQAVVHVRVSPPEDLRKALQEALCRPDLLELYGAFVAGQRSLVAQYDALAARLLPLTPSDGGGALDLHALQRVVNEFAALEIYKTVLPYYESHWDAPQKAYAELLKAQKLAPQNPLILTALAEVLLQLDRPAAAMEYVCDVLNSAPEFARAHDVKGAIFLRQRMPALAADSFSKAISLSPKNPEYYVHRAAARLVQEDLADMCSDFQSACALGDCEGFQWARGAGKCQAQ